MGDFLATWYMPLTGGAILGGSILGVYVLRMRRGRDAVKSTHIIVFTLMYFIALTAAALLPMTPGRYLMLGLAVYVAILLVHDPILAIVRRHTRRR